jgi:hypothetical protein
MIRSAGGSSITMSRTRVPHGSIVSMPFATAATCVPAATQRRARL